MTDSTQRQPSDHAARLRALDPASSFLVQAPAGSGKTELLTDRILALLATVSRPEEIVAITFTRKAASEMHARVLQKLQRALDDTPPTSEHGLRSWTLARAALAHDRRQDWQIMAHPARLSIRTIDSFCAGLVRGMPWLTGLGGMPAITDDARAHFNAAASATLALADDFDAVRVLLAHLDVDVGAAREALSGMLGHRDQWLPLLAQGADRDTMQADLAQAVGEDLRAVVAAMPPGWSHTLAPSARAAVQVLDAVDADHKLAALRDWHEPLGDDPATLSQWRAVAELLLTSTGTLRSPKGINKNHGFPPNSAHKAPLVEWLAASAEGAHWVALLARVRDLPDPIFSDRQWEVLDAQLMSLRLAAAQLSVRFAQTGEVDFIEIAQRVTQALGNADVPGELLLKLDASIRHLLIDEFQDTSQSQIDLLERLIAGWEEGDGRTLFLVGDPMQSIYRFRKAEVGLFLRVRDEGIGMIQPEFLNLTDNFRSQAGIVHWVNTWFANMMPRRDDAATGAISYTPSQAFHPALAGSAVQFHPGWMTDDPDQAEQQAQVHVATLIREIRAQAGDDASIAILVRARSHLAGLARHLTQAGIVFRAVELVPLASRPAVSDLVQLVSALAHPADRLAWLSVLRAPWCGLTLNDLHALVHAWPQMTVPDALRRMLAQGAPASLSADGLARVRRVGAILLSDAPAVGAQPFAAMLSEMWHALGGPALYAGQQALEDVESLFGLIEKLAPYGQPDPQALALAVQRLYATPAAARVSVDMMTMHKSKGLQFDHVILYGLHRAPRGDQAPLVRFEQSGHRLLFGPVKPRADTEADPLSRYLATRERQRSDYETVRLLYVAATRARHRLHLIGSVGVDANGNVRLPPAESLLGRLWPALGEVVVPPSLGQEVDAAVSEPAQAPRLLSRVAIDAAVAGAPNGEGLGVWPRAAFGVPVSTGAAWSEQAAYEAPIGTLAHAWLEHLGVIGSHRWHEMSRGQRLPQLERQLTRAGVPESAASQAAEAVWETLESTLNDERGQWLLSQAGARREWPLIDAAGRVSVIDLALSTEEGWLIVDYKTGKPRPQETHAQFADRMRERYADQLRRYCEQVQALDGRAARAALYFPRASLWIDMPAAGTP